MYKAYKNDKIIGISDTDQEFLYLTKDYVEEDSEHNATDYGIYNNEYVLVSEIPPKTYEEIRVLRNLAYKENVDEITLHIQRLRDKEQTEEIVSKIEALIKERDEKVQEIEEKYPYPEETIDSEE